MVGCVIVHNGEIVSEGYHKRFGGPHAEVNAFKKLAPAINTNECEVYVNLEPCSHYGKTPPCANLIVEMNPKRVTVGMLDPYTKVAGRGIKKLRDAGLKVTVGVLEDECTALNRKFITAHANQRPFVTLKWAETNNGFMARLEGDNQPPQISDVVNIPLVHNLRATHQAILVGANTINRDLPRLDVRSVDGNNPIKIVLSKTLNVDLNAATFSTGYTLLYNTVKSKKMDNYELIRLKDMTLDSVLADLYSRDIHSVLVEGGSQVLTSFIENKVWDQVIILKSEVDWDTGIKAPWVGIPSVSEKISGNDTIKYFIPK
jgi:diaminohydroxyphosphoribosylaminopyrimidine deaminase/5-amino-6-(5-phosphoribosylamino)uracil reductase